MMQQSSKFSANEKHNFESFGQNCLSLVECMNSKSNVSSSSTVIASILPDDQKILPWNEKDLQPQSHLNSSKNYFCYANGCKKIFKYLYLFKFHMAGHGIFHFDCEFCRKRFPKYLLFKKHMRNVHGLSVKDYRIKPAQKGSYNVFEKDSNLNRKHGVSDKLTINKSAAPNISNNHDCKIKASLDDLIHELLSALNSQVITQNGDFMFFDLSMLETKDSEFPSFNGSIQ